MAGHIDLMFDQAANSLPQVRGGNVRAYAVTSRSRLASAPDIPTVDEAGLPGLYTAHRHGIWAPTNAPDEVITKLNAAIVAALADPAVQQRFLELGQEMPPPERQTPVAPKSHQIAEIGKWWPIVKAANIKAETLLHLISGAMSAPGADVGMPVVKVVVQGLRHFWARYAPGRLNDVPVKMGWLEKPLREEELNPIPIFF